MSEAFRAGWSVLKMPYHITESDNWESIKRDGLLPKNPGHNFGLAEAIDDVMNQYNMSEDVALAYLTATAKRFGMKSAEDLFDPGRNWVYAADDDYNPKTYQELAGYGAMMQHPIVLDLRNDDYKWMRDYGYTTRHQRSPLPVGPKDIEIAFTFQPRGEGEEDHDYEQYLFDVMMGRAT